MLEKTLKKAGANVAEQISSVLDDKLNPKTEWHAFTCEVDHSFAVEIHTNISTKKVMEFYGKLRCPLCQTDELKKQNNL